MKSYKVHYMNKYPGCRVDSREDSLDVYSSDGQHRVSLRKNGAGQWVDVSAENGCVDSHDLSPIPRNTRLYKLYPNGKVDKSEEFDDRSQFSQRAAESEIGGAGKVPSIAEILKAKGKLSGRGDYGESNQSWEIEETTPPRIIGTPASYQNVPVDRSNINPAVSAQNVNPPISEQDINAPTSDAATNPPLSSEGVKQPVSEQKAS